MDSPDHFRQVCSSGNLRQAWLRVEESDGGMGIDGVSLSRFANNLTVEIDKLQRELVAGTYRPLPLLRFFVPKSDGGQRPLNIAAVRDRVAQHALIGVVEPLLEAEFEICSYGYRHGRSVKQALQQIEFLRDNGFKWVVEADITAYFDSVNHEMLFARVADLIPDARLQHFIKLWVAARVYDGHRLWTLETGLPQGAPISPCLANLYLDSFDEEMLAGGRKLIRFADDFVILCRTKPKAEAALRLTRRLMQELKLSLNESKTRVTNFAEGFKYLGVVFTNSFCLTKAPPKREQAPAQFPPVLPLLYGLPVNETVFNLALRDALKDALAAPENEVVPTCFMRAKKEEQVMSPTEISGDAAQMIPQPIGTVETLADFPPPALFTIRTLYLHEHGAVVRCEHERLYVCKDEEELLSLPLNKIDQLVMFGNSQLTTTVIKRCLQRGISIILLSGQGRFLGSIEVPGNQNVLLQQQQFARLGDADFVLDMARRIVSGKIQNSRTLLQRRQRVAADERLSKAIQQMQRLKEQLDAAATLDEARGYEGAASAAYFAGFGSCVAAPFTFKTRVRRPPSDPVNALLSFGYTMLLQNIYALARARGLSPYVGMLHALRVGHPALCSDLIEELRAPIVDSLVTTLLNKKVFALTDFYEEEADEDEIDEAGAGETVKRRSRRLTDEARRKFIVNFEQRMNSTLRHPQAAIRTTWRGCLDLQLGHYIKVLRGEAAHYIPLVIR
jgi:CRISPR-associated protein Cas1